MDNDVISDSSSGTRGGAAAPGGSGAPAGEREEGSPSGTCPQTRGTIMVHVREGRLNPQTDRPEATEKCISGAQITVQGPTGDSQPSNPQGCREFRDRAAGDYSVSLSLGALPDYAGGTVSRTSPAQERFTLAPGGSQTVDFLVCPPMTAARVKVRSTDRKQVIRGHEFDVTLGRGGELAKRTTAGDALFPDLAAATFEASVTLQGQQAELFKAPKEPVPVTVVRGRIAEVEILLKPRTLELVSVKHHFAPGEYFDRQQIRYRTQGLDGDRDRVLLQVLSDSYEGGATPIFEQELSWLDRQDGEHTFEWDGKANCSQGALKDGRHIHPLLGPFKVRLFHTDALKTDPADPKAQFFVLYHSIVLELMSWEDVFKAVSGLSTFDLPSGADERLKRMWVAARLNDLGFWAGPVDGNDSPELKRGLRQFKLAHPGLSGWKERRPFYGREPIRTGDREERLYDEAADAARPNGLQSIDPKLIEELNSRETRRSLRRTSLSQETAIANKAEASRIYLDNHRFFFGEYSEFEARGKSHDAPEAKFSCERQWLNRPCLPLRARVKIMDSNNRSVNGAEGVGPAPLLWSWQDIEEDKLRTTPGAARVTADLPQRTAAEPSNTREFVLQAQQQLRKPTYKGTPVEAGGIISGTAASDAVAVFAPCAARGVSEYAHRPTGVLARAFMHDGPKKIENVALGSSIVYLCPSLIAGDNYKVKVVLDLDQEAGHPSLPRLKNEHAARRGDLAAETGWLVLWRRMWLAAYVGWPARAGLDAALALVQREFEPCYVELEVSRKKVYDITDVFVHSPAYAAEPFNDYKNMVRRVPGESLGEGLKQHLLSKPTADTFSAQSIYPGDPEILMPRQPFKQYLLKYCRLDDTRECRLRKEIDERFLTGRAAASDADRTATNRSVNFLMKVIDAWKNPANAATDPLVRNAATTLHTELQKWLVEAPPGQWSVKPVGDNPGELNAAGLASINFNALPADDLTAPQADSILLPQPFRDEIEAYAAAAAPPMPAATFASQWADWINTVAYRQADDPRPDEFARSRPLEGNLTEIWNQEIIKIISSEQFKQTVPPYFRRDILKMRITLLRRTLGSMVLKLKSPLAEQTDLAVRKKLADENGPADGLILLDYQTTEPRTINGQPFIVDGVAFGGLNGVVLLDQGLASGFGPLIAHEIAHCTFLHHWRNCTPSVRENHDLDDDNCLMSYPYPFNAADYTKPTANYYLKDVRFWTKEVLSPERHYSLDQFKPHFCGKCNLQLRGWRLRAGPLVPIQRTVDKPPLSQPIAVKILAADAPDASATAPNRDFIGISFYPSDLAGAQTANHHAFTFAALQPFPSGFGDNPHAGQDPAAFRIEVIDENRDDATVNVTLEALKPMYDPTGKFTGAWEPFPEDERKKRCLVNVECQRVAQHRYRSRYLRLVTDEIDRIALNTAPFVKQGLLVTDMADGVIDNDGNAPKDFVEILEQQVRVIYDPTPP